jgi:ketosteroid isomerase-like protein
VPSTNVELVRRAFELFNAGVPTLPEFWAEGAELWPAPGFPEGGVCRGRGEIERFFNRSREGLKDTTVVLGETEDAGDKVFLSFQWRATGESSGAETSSEWFAVFTFRAGKIVRLEFFAELDAAKNAAGLE